MNKNTISERTYPLYWPEGWPRTASYEVRRSRFDDRTVYRSRQVLEVEIRRFGGTELIISSNLELKLDGTPRSNQKQPADRGVAIYFKKDGTNMALACDVYLTVEDNLWAICRTLEALRQIERDGSPTLINRAFRGFKALPDPGQLEWWEVLGVQRMASDEEIRTAYFCLAKQYHPDVGGDAATFYKISKAFQLAKGRK